MGAQPVYNHVQWEDAYRRSATYLKNTSKSEKLDQSASGVHNPAEDGEDELRYVLKEGKKIGQTYFLVEMATDGRTLAISAYDGDSRRTLELLVNEKNHRRLYRDANGDYNLIADKLRVDGEQLIIDAGVPSGGTADAPSPF